MTEIEKARKALGWSRPKMAEEMEIPRRTIEAWEWGDREPPAYVEKLVLAEMKRRLEEQ